MSIQEIKKKIGSVKNRQRKVPSKGAPERKITLDCDFTHKAHDDYYVLGVDLEYQITARKGMPYQRTRDFFAFLFFEKEKVLVVLGRDKAIPEVIKVVSDILYGDVQDLKPFISVGFGKDSLVRIIGMLKEDDSDSWCDEHNAIHGALRFDDRKTKTNFSLGEGNCVLEDDEANREIANATSINPKYRFYKLPKMNIMLSPKPQTLKFNGTDGVISISRFQDFENWEMLIAKFLLKHLELS